MTNQASPSTTTSGLLLSLAIITLALACGGSDSHGQPQLVASEAGYYELQPITFSLRKTPADSTSAFTTESGAARLLYSFHPAEVSPLTKPLLVMLNGGPGCATTTNLFSMNTASFTLDRERIGSAQYGVNPWSWTALGNLLYIDAPDTGFSYNLLPDATDSTKRFYEFGYHNFNPWLDAAQVVRVVLRFLDNHPQIKANPVILVGESYGGTRVSTMLNLILFYGSYAQDGQRVFRDAALSAELDAHLHEVFGGDPAAPVPVATIARQFGQQILIQPQLTGPYQSELAGMMFQLGDNARLGGGSFTPTPTVIDGIAQEVGQTFTHCTSGCNYAYESVRVQGVVSKTFNRDPYNFSKPATWGDDLERFAMDRLLSVSTLSTLLKTDARQIQFLRPEARHGYAYRCRMLDTCNLMQSSFDRSLLDSQMTLAGGAPSSNYGLLDYKFVPSGEVAAVPEASLGGDDSLEKTFGPLAAWDSYLKGTLADVYMTYQINNVAMAGYPVSPDFSPIFGEMFLQNLAVVRTFLTDAGKDIVIYSPALVYSFEGYTAAVASVTRTVGTDTTNGSVTIAYQPTFVIPGVVTPVSQTMPYPYYGNSGHSVSSAQPDKLLRDVQQWLR